MKLVPTPSQTVGPFFNYALTTNAALGTLASDAAQGERIRLSIRLVDGADEPAPGDGMIELWQADAAGRYAHTLDPRAADADKNFSGFGRLETDMNGVCVFHTVKPGSVAADVASNAAPHINVAVFARGLLKQLYTRIYFAGDPANDADPVLALVPPERRVTLMAKLIEGVWSIEIRLQGDDETVFFDV